MTTLTAIADGLGIDKALACRYAKRGMPITSVAAAAAWKAANVRSRVKPAAAKKKRRASPPRAKGGGDAPEKLPPMSPYEAAKARIAMAEAEEKELALLERKGILVRPDTIRAELARRLSGLRDALLQIPARLQSILAAETDEAKVGQIIEDELYLALQAAADLLAEAK